MRKIYTLLLTIFSFYSAFSQWNTNVAVNLEVSGLKAADMQTVFTPNKRTWVAFYHQNPATSNYDMRAQLIDENGYKLLGPDGILVNNKRSGTATFVFNVCTDAEGNLIIGMQDQRTAPNVNSAVGFKVSQNGTMLWPSDGVVLGLGLSPNPCTISTGETVFAWIENATSTLNMHKVSATGTLVWPTAKEVKVGTSRTTRGQIVPNSNGAFTMVYQRSGVGVSTTLFVQRFNNDGTVAYAPLQICNQTTSGTRYYSIDFENDTTYFGYFASQGSRFNSFLQRINPDGTLPWGINGSNFNTSTAASDPYQQTTNIALTPGSPYVWSVCSFSNTSQSQFGIFVQKFLKSTGARQFTNTGKQVFPISTSVDRQEGSLKLVNDAPFFMQYDATYKMYAVKLDSDGNFVWTPNRIDLSSTTAGGSTPKGRFGFTNVGTNQCVATWYESRAGEYRGYAQNISFNGLHGVDVQTAGAVPPTITTHAGTLQMTATVYPLTANQNVTWSLAAVTGNATISATGLVTGVWDGNGTVWAIATSVQDPTMKDSLLITISGQNISVKTLQVITKLGVAPRIMSATDSLEMAVIFTPANATFKDVVWSIRPISGVATITANGVVYPLDEGDIWVKAVSVQHPTVMDSMIVSIYGQRTTNLLPEMVIYPNPSTNGVYLKLQRNHPAMMLQIVDMTGKIVYEKYFEKDALRKVVYIDMSRFPAGMYLFDFNGPLGPANREASGIDATFKVIKQ